MTSRLSGAVLGAALALLLAGCGGSEELRSELLLVSTRDGDYAIYAMNADGGAQKRLSERAGEPAGPRELFFQLEPAWSPNGQRIAFASRRSGSFDIYVMNPDGTGTRRITATKHHDRHPSWSADGRRLAFARGPGDIYVVRADGSGARRISDPQVEESDPAWSPDGRWIAYVRRTPGSDVSEIWVTRPDGSGRRKVTSQGARAFTPAWSPDGRRIVFSSNAGGEVFELYTIGLDGNGLRSVATTAEGMFEPSWSPDGSRIAFSEGGAIFSVELGGEDARKLTDTDNNDSSPAWNPRPPAKS